MNILRIFVNRIVTPVVLVALLVAQTADARRDEGPDLSILEQRAELSRYLTREQAIQVKQTDRAIKAAEDEIQRGTYKATQKPSKLRTEDELDEIHEAGEAMVEAGNAKLLQAQTALVELFQAAQTQKEAAIAALRKTYRLELDTATYEDALKAAAETTLKACWAAEYKTVFFDDVYLTNDTLTQKLNSEFRNFAYDTLIEIDGSQYSVSMPINLTYGPGAGEDTEARFRCDNEAALSNGKVALLHIELVAQEGSHTGLLLIGALDIQSHMSISSQVVVIENIPELLGQELTEEPTNGSITASVTLTDIQSTLSRLEQAGAGYQFQLDSAQIEQSELPVPLHHVLVSQLLMDNFAISLVNNHFIERAYTGRVAIETKESEMKTVTLRIESSPEGAQMSAQASGQPRVLEIGPIELGAAWGSAPESTEDAE